MKDYMTASIPVLCKNGVWGDSASGRKLITASAVAGKVQFASEKRDTLNQTLKEKQFGYTIDCIDQCQLCFDVFEAGRINKHGLIWVKVFSAVFKPGERNPPECLGQYHLAYWLGPEGTQHFSKNLLVRDPSIPTVEEICRSLWRYEKPFTYFPSDPLEILRAWTNGELEILVKQAFNPMTFLQKYRFGLEVEFTGISRDAAARTVAQVLGSEKQYLRDSFHTHVISDSLLRQWKIVRDGSIQPCNRLNTAFKRDNYRCELVTPIITYSYGDLSLLQKVITSLKSRGATVTPTCGIHIHVDLQFNARQLRNLVNIVASKEDLLKRSIRTAPARRDYCRYTNQVFIDRINSVKNVDLDSIRDAWYDDSLWRMTKAYDDSRYVTLNLHSLWQGKGVEFRCFNSTLDQQLIRTYILLTLGICNQAALQKRASYLVSKACDRVAMSNWLNQMGFTGQEFKTFRQILLHNLTTSDRISAA